mgnify:CR=1 FL=1
MLFLFRMSARMFSGRMLVFACCTPFGMYRLSASRMIVVIVWLAVCIVSGSLSCEVCSLMRCSMC